MGDIAFAERLFAERLEVFAYLRRVHESENGTFWLNSVLLDRRDIEDLYDDPRMAEHAHAFLMLGMGLGKLSSAPCSFALRLRDALQLFEEFEFALAPAPVHSVKTLMAKKLRGAGEFPPSRALRKATLEADHAVRRAENPSEPPLPRYASLPPPALRKSGGTVVFEQLWIVAMPHRLDFVQVLLTLCLTLSAFYAQLRDAMRAELHAQGAVDQGALAALVKFDGRLKLHVIDIVAKELTDYAERKMGGELASIASRAPEPAVGSKHPTRASPATADRIADRIAEGLQ